MFNKYQSSIEDLNIENQDPEIQEQFYDFINNVPNIRNLISLNRPKAKDLPKDEEGKIIIDVTQPHTLEDMDYFRPAALHYSKYGCYTKLRPNNNPNSEYYKWISEEYRRCWYGYVRPSDGEWITGDYYFYLNYCPILLIKKNKDGSNIRVVDFPNVWDGQYYKFHFLNQCRKEGKHYMELASRGKGKSFGGASLLAKRFILGESEKVQKKVQCMVTASEKKFLAGGNQILNMFQSYIDFNSNHHNETNFPYMRVVSSLQNMQWTMGYVDTETKAQGGSLNSVTGITSKDDESKLRGTRGVLYIIEESGCHLEGTEVLMYDGTIKKVEDIAIGDKLMGDDSTPRIVQELYNGIDEMYKVSLKNGDFQIINSHHPIYYHLYDYKGNVKNKISTAPELLKKNLDIRYKIPKASLEFQDRNIFIRPYLLGLWLGNGDSTRVSIANKDKEVLIWLDNNYNGYIRDLKQSESCKIYHIPTSEKEVYNSFKYYNLFNNKHIPNEYKISSRNTRLQLIAGLIDTNGTYDHRRRSFEITQQYTRKHIIEDLLWIVNSLGLKGTISTRKSTGKKPGVLHYRLRITGEISIIPTKISRKQASPHSGYRNKIRRNDYTFKIEPYGKGKFYGFTVDKNNLFVLKDLTITHNTFPRLLKLWSVMRPSVEDGKSVFGTLMAYGTAGDNDSDFSSMQEMMYNPDGYNLKGIKNVYDKEGQGRAKFTYFYPAYLNMAECYDENGNSDITKALLVLLQERFKVKYNSTDINAITKRIAEYPITPQEAIIRSRGNIFPVTQLNERLNEIDNNPTFYNDTYVGELVQNKEGKIEFKPTLDIPIRDFPTKDNKVSGAIEIFEMPQEIQGKVPRDRYIISLDNYENDTANTMSLGSLFVLDLWTDRIVAEYTGRPMFSDDLNEIARKFCLFYNAKLLYENNKKSTFAYFSRMNSLYLLEDTPEYLRQKQLIKTVGYGNTSKGVTATVPIKNHGFTLIRDWLLKPVPVIQKTEDGEYEVTLPNLHYIKNRALIKELILFNPDINVDRVMSLVQLMIFRESKMVLYNGDLKKDRDTIPSDYTGNDDFFEKNYRRKQ